MALDLMPGFGAFTPAAGGGTPVTWNSADKNANLTLSVGDLLVTKTAGATAYESVRSTGGKSSGKYYFETSTTYTNVGEDGVGIGNASASLTNYAGSTNDSIGIFPRTGSGCQIYLNASLAATAAAIAAEGDRIGISVDLDGDSIGFTIDGTSYTDVSIATMAAGPYFIFANCYTVTDSTCRIYTDSADWSFSARAGGYGEWSA